MRGFINQRGYPQSSSEKKDELPKEPIFRTRIYPARAGMDTDKTGAISSSVEAKLPLRVFLVGPNASGKMINRDPIVISSAVEGIVDEAVIRRLIEHFGAGRPCQYAVHLD